MIIDQVFSLIIRFNVEVEFVDFRSIVAYSSVISITILVFTLIFKFYRVMGFNFYAIEEEVVILLILGFLYTILIIRAFISTNSEIPYRLFPISL